MKLQGTITALTTPFANQKVEENLLIKQIHRQLEQKVDAILLMGITGESCTLTSKEQKRIMEIGKAEIANQVPLIIGTGCNSTEQTMENTSIAQKMGADAALVVTPYFNKPTQTGIFKHFEAIAKKVDLPLVIYNHPGRVIVSIEIETFIKIAKLPNVLAIKDAAESLSKAGDLIYALKKNNSLLSVLCADDASTYAMMALGADGVISAASNLVPAKIVAMVNALKQEKYNQALKLHYELLPLFQALCLETNPIPVKTAMNLCGISAGEFRLPLCEMEAAHTKELQKVLQEMKLLV